MFIQLLLGRFELSTPLADDNAANSEVIFPLYLGIKFFSTPRAFRGLAGELMGFKFCEGGPTPTAASTFVGITTLCMSDTAFKGDWLVAILTRFKGTVAQNRWIFAGVISEGARCIIAPSAL